MFCDPNDWYELDACEICYDKISKGDNDIAFFSLNRYLDDTGEFKYRIVTTNDFISKTPNNFWCGKNVFINFKIINKNNIEFPNYIIHEDHDFGLTLLMHTNNICCAETRLYYYRLRTGSIMNRGGKNTINNVPKILKKYLPIFKVDINQILNFYKAISCFYTTLLLRKKANNLEQNDNNIDIVLDCIAKLHCDIVNIKNKKIKDLTLEIDIFKNQTNIVKMYGTAKSRIHNQLSYKLDQAMIANSKSIWGYIRMPYILSYIKDIHKKEQIAYNEKVKANPNLKLPPLESYPDYKEALKEKECLTYKLGEALINADKSKLKLGYITLWFKCKNIQKECKKR